MNLPALNNILDMEMDKLTQAQGGKTNMEDTDSWDAFSGAYLKPEDVTDDDEFALIKVGSEEMDKRTKLVLTLERAEISKLFTCNATNIKAIREAFPEGPKAAVGSKVGFDKVKVTNPSTKQIQDSLVIKFLE